MSKDLSLEVKRSYVSQQTAFYESYGCEVEDASEDFKDGWAAAEKALTTRAANVSKFLRSFDDPLQDKLLDMMISDHVSIFEKEANQFHILINVNDLFYHSSSDAEEIEEKDINDVYELYQKHGGYGLYAWVAHKRNEQPLERHRNEKFLAAYDSAERQPALKERAAIEANVPTSDSMAPVKKL